MGVSAVIFDFDGLIIDPEMGVYAAASTMLGSMGHEVSIEQWAALVGLGEDDSWHALCETLGCEIDRARYDEVVWAEEASWQLSIPLLPGVMTLLDELGRAGVPCGVASSSPASWITPHLDRHGLRERFDVIASSDRIDGRAKPAPDVYLLACQELGVEPAAAVALEDSPVGVAAAIAAGLVVVAVPNAVTRLTDLSAAHQFALSLEHVTLDGLSELIRGRTPRSRATDEA